MYEIAKVAPVFGSRRDEYTPESIVAIHDACGVVMPHAYDAGPAEEVNEFLARPRHGRRRRADQPAGADRRRRRHPRALEADASTAATVCLVNQRQRPRLPDQGRSTLDGGASVTAGRGGCVTVPAGTKSVAFAGDRRRPAVLAAPRPRDRRRHRRRRRSRSRSARRRASAPSRRASRKSYTAPRRPRSSRTAGDAALTVADPAARSGQRRVHAPAAAAGSSSVKAAWSGAGVQRRRPDHVQAARSAPTTPLRTGTYAKTLTFTLSTTAP